MGDKGYSCAVAEQDNTRIIQKDERIDLPGDFEGESLKNSSFWYKGSKGKTSTRGIKKREKKKKKTNEKKIREKMENV